MAPVVVTMRAGQRAIGCRVGAANVPAEPAWVVITVPVVDALAELPAAGAEPGDAVAALLHAVASSAEASGMPSLTGTGIRASNERIIFIVSSRATTCAALGRAAVAPLSSCLMT